MPILLCPAVRNNGIGHEDQQLARQSARRIGLTAPDAILAEDSAFVRRSRLESGWELGKILDQVRLFSSGPLAAAAEGRPFDLSWRPGALWE